jgi:Sec-independent protein secretion pathway component TatC
VSVWSIILFLLAALYLFGGIFEFPIMFEGNPKTRWLMEKMGKRNLKLLILSFAVIFAVLAVILK